MDLLLLYIMVGVLVVAVGHTYDIVLNKDDELKHNILYSVMYISFWPMLLAVMLLILAAAIYREIG